MVRISTSLAVSSETSSFKSVDGEKESHARLPTETSFLLPTTDENDSFAQHNQSLVSTTAFPIAIFSTTFFIMIVNISSTTLVLDKVCSVHLGYPDDVCKNLNNHTDFKASAEKMAANYSLALKLLRIVPTVFFSIVAGPWSDKYGRKLLLLLSVFGSVVDVLGAYLCSYFQYARLEYYLMAAAIMGLTGGHTTLAIFFYSYVSDSTTTQKRTMKYALLEILSGIAQPLSVAAGGWIYSFYGYAAVFLISICGLTIDLMWIVFLLPEAKVFDHKDSWKVKIRAFFSCEMLTDSFIVTTKQRANNGRRVILLFIISNCVAFSAIYATPDINFLYVNHQFNWGNTEYSMISSLYLSCALLALLLIVPILKRFQIKDPIIGLIGSLSLIAKYLGIGLARKTAIFHLANVFGLLSGCTTIALRSCLSKQLPKDEIGKLFSFMVISEATFPIVSSVVIAQIFNAFLEIYPGMPYIFIAISLLLPFSTFIWILYRKDPGCEVGKYDLRRDSNEKIRVT